MASTDRLRNHDLDPLRALPGLEVSGLSVSYWGDAFASRAVDRVSFTINDGEAVGLCGESGCGKTTIALALLGLLPPNAQVDGSIRFGDRELRELSESELRQVRGKRISIVFQEPELALHPLIRVGDQVAEVIRAHEHADRRRARDMALALLADVGLGEPSGRQMYSAYPHELSGGQRQRVAIAQALACRPSLVIADEPTASVDSIVQAEILALIRTLARRHTMALLFISHNPGVLAAITDRLLVMSAGRIVETGATSRLFLRPVEPYTRALLASLPRCRDGSAAPWPVGSVGAAPPRGEDQRPAVRVTQLRKSYTPRRFLARNRSTVVALAGIDLTLRAGSTLALVGASGSGKSTLARCLALLEEADSGEIWFGETDVARRRGRELRPYRRKAQLVFQDSASALNPRLTALELVAEPLVVQRLGTPAERRERALDLLDQVGISRDRAARVPADFSGGQRQRLALARALALAPSLLILDEALSGLDLPIQAQLLALLRRLQTQYGLTYLCITHDLGLVGAFADEVAVMYEGRIVERGAAAAMLRSPQHPHTRALVAAVPYGPAKGAAPDSPELRESMTMRPRLVDGVGFARSARKAPFSH